jgi:hypothetical protein
MPKDGEDSVERTVLQDPKVIQETLELMDPPGREVYKVQLDLEDCKVPKGRKVLKVQKAWRVLQLETRVIKQKEDHLSRKKSRCLTFLNLMALRKHLVPGYLREIIGTVIVKPGAGVSP